MATPSHPFLDWEGPIPFAHRGGASEAPENTMPAFQHAIDLGYRYLETDVQVTADGVLVAFHDAHLGRTTGHDARIESMRFAQLRELRVGGVAPIPTLAEILGEWPDVRVNIDCKTDAAVEPLAEVIEHTASIDRVCVGAFRDRRLRQLRERLGDRLCTALGPRAVARLLLPGGGVPPGDAAQVPVHYGKLPVTTPRFVERAHRAGIAVHVWTIDDRDEMHRLCALGVDGIMTDRPELLREVLIERGVWHG